MSRLLLLVGLAILLPGAAAFGAEPEASPRGLDIWFIDTEGGAATLIVTPKGESVLIDCGNPGARDAERIRKVAVETAGLTTIDHLAITHWHSDHYGGASRLAELIPIRNFYDRGIPETLEEDPKNFPLLIAAYRKASKDRSRTLKPGDEIPLRQTDSGPAVKLLCLCSAREVVADRKGSPENPIARDHQPKDEDRSDNANSLGFLLSFDGFRFLDLGDLTWNMEYKLVAPTDKIGPVDVYQVTHHGLDISNNDVLVRTVKPRLAIFNNGPRKGCMPAVTTALRRLADPPVICQMHRNVTVGAQENTDPDLIANPQEDCQGESIKLSVAPDGKSYTLTVGSKGKPRKFETREAGK
jgi:beta-lactamase superfamily II metal-dependent hydrolase